MIKSKNLILFFCLHFLIFNISISFTQAPLISWQNDIGGSAVDELFSIIPISDGGYILAGHSFSDISGDKSENHIGSSDYWVIKVNETGNIMWQKTIGGTNSDFLTCGKLTSDGGYIFAGYSRSDSSGNKSEDVIGGILTIYDYWVVKTDSIGNVQWENTIGGTNNDYLYSVDFATDGSYYLGGYSSSNISPDKSEDSYGGYDYWVIKIDSVGNVIWENTIGGSADEYLYSITSTDDGGCFLGGYSSSGISGEKTQASKGFNDYWVIKLNSLGEIIWQKTIGGSQFDYLKSVEQTTDGGYILGGYSTSGVSGDKTESNHGLEDYWIIKLDAVGNIVWQNAINGNNTDKLQCIYQTLDGGYILGGYSKSLDLADKTENPRGGYDYWIVKLSSTGAVQWDKTLGGTLDDQLNFIQQSYDGSYILGGKSLSGHNGDKSEVTNGVEDFWVIKMAYCIQEVCNGLDDDCDGNVDDSDPDVFGQPIWYADFDGDTFGSEILDTLSCHQPIGYISDNNDCDDFNPETNPIGMEIINGIDDNCDDIIDVIDNLFLKGEYIELGINSCGAYVSSEPPPYGFHPNYTISDIFKLGMVADSDKDGWEIGAPKYCGDYSIPGNPIEGWAIEINDTVWYNAEANCAANDIPGANIYYEKNLMDVISVWEGAITEKDIQIKQQTHLIDSNLFFITTITIINDGMLNLNNVYYLRTIDPDQEVVLDNEFSTHNTVLLNPPIDSDALVTAEGLTFGCFLGMGARNSNARVSFGDFGIIGHIPSEVYDGVDLYELSGSDTADYNNSIVFKIPSITSGDSVQFAFAYIFNSDEIEQALEATELCTPSPELCNTLDDNCNGLIDDGVVESISISAGGPTTFCQGGSVVLSAIYSGATVQWKKDGVNIAGATSANYTVTKKGNYTCVTTSPCGTATSSIINVIVNKNPNASISAGGATTFCAGGSVTLTEVPSGGCTYQWYKGPSAIAGATTTNYIATTTGNYKCRVTKTATGCYKNSNPIAVSVPCREDEITSNENNSFTLFPNPANDKLNIQINSQLLSPFSFQLTITDLEGRIIYTRQLNSPTTEINISDFASGMYFVKIKMNDKEMIEKFIKN